MNLKENVSFFYQKIEIKKRKRKKGEYDHGEVFTRLNPQIPIPTSHYQKWTYDVWNRMIRYLNKSSRMLFLPELGVFSDGPGCEITKESIIWSRKRL